MIRCAVLTGEYPPQPGGVSDYTRLVAEALSEAGVEVHVWCGGNSGTSRETGDITVHRVGGSFDRAGRARLATGMDRFPRPRTLFIQYAPHSFGLRNMNVPFAWWLQRRARRGDDLRVIFHEVAFPFVRRPLKWNLIAVMQNLMASLVLDGCRRAYVTTPAWVPRLQVLGRLPSTDWLPVPSNVPTGAAPEEVARLRQSLPGDPAGSVLGHFGTYGRAVAGLLTDSMERILAVRPDARWVLLGRGATRFRESIAVGRPDWQSRVIAIADLHLSDIAAWLKACDVAIQPYPDGATCRRGSLMAALANGVATVTTIGSLSEPLWSNHAIVPAYPVDRPDELATATLRLLADSAERIAIGRRAAERYRADFSLNRTIDVLLGRRPALLSWKESK